MSTNPMKISRKQPPVINFDQTDFANLFKVINHDINMQSNANWKFLMVDFTWVVFFLHERAERRESLWRQDELRTAGRQLKSVKDVSESFSCQETSGL